MYKDAQKRERGKIRRKKRSRREKVADEVCREEPRQCLIQKEKKRKHRNETVKDRFETNGRSNGTVH